MKKLTILLFMTALSVLSACNTLHGIGKDLEKVGEAIGRS